MQTVASPSRRSVVAVQAAAWLVPGEGVEPSRYCYRRILSPLRLPFRHPGCAALDAPRIIAEIPGARAARLATTRANPHLARDGLNRY